MVSTPRATLSVANTSIGGLCTPLGRTGARQRISNRHFNANAIWDSNWTRPSFGSDMKGGDSRGRLGASAFSRAAAGAVTSSRASSRSTTQQTDRRADGACYGGSRTSGEDP